MSITLKPSAKPFISLAILAIVLLCAHNSYSQQQSKLDWPRTFSGQPDFDFARDEVLKDLEEREEELDINAYHGTINDLLKDLVVNPFTPRPRFLRENEKNLNIANPFLPLELVTSGNVVESNEELPSEIQPVSGLPEFDLITLKLPSVDSTNTSQVDLSEFKAFVDNIISQDFKTQDPNFTEHDFTKDLERLRLQSISTSPNKYAIINGRRYNEGDRFMLPVTIEFDDSGIRKIIEAYMPSILDVDEDVYKQYEKLRDDALAAYREKLKAQAQASNANRHKVSVTVKEIVHRRVILSVMGKTYEIELRVAL